MGVCFYRDCKAYYKIHVGDCSDTGVTISDPISLEHFWSHPDWLEKRLEPGANAGTADTWGAASDLPFRSGRSRLWPCDHHRGVVVVAGDSSGTRCCYAVGLHRCCREGVHSLPAHSEKAASHLVVRHRRSYL